MDDTTRDSETVMRRTFPTAAFTLLKSQIAWIEVESKRRRTSKSEIIRDLIDRAMSDADATERQGVAA